MSGVTFISKATSSRSYDVPIGALALWIDTSPPYGWTFETSLDDYFVMGSNEVDLTARGALTHKHSNPNTNTTGTHSNHNGFVTINSVTNWDTQYSPGTYYVTGNIHGHSDNTISNQSEEGNHYHTLPDTNEASNLPQYKRLRWIKAGFNADFPIGAIIMHNVGIAAFDDNWKVCDGLNGTPDMRGLFVYGGIGDDGGSDTHYHTNNKTDEAGEHSHSVTITTGNVSTSFVGATKTGGLDNALEDHVHITDEQSSDGGLHQHDVDDTSEENVLPPYIQLYFIQRKQ
jgi:hypothetical protein